VQPRFPGKTRRRVPVLERNVEHLRGHRLGQPLPGELLHERQDRWRSVRPVQIEERLARPAAAEVDPATVDLDETLAECHDAGVTAAGS